jgi:hypothetical protein
MRMRQIAGARTSFASGSRGVSESNMLVSTALSLMLTLGAGLVAPDGCEVVAVWEDGSAVATCSDGNTWFEYDPDITRDGLWSISRSEPPELVALRAETATTMSQRDPGAGAPTT